MHTDTISSRYINIQHRFHKYKKTDTNKPAAENTPKSNGKKAAKIGLITLGVGLLFLSKGVQKNSKKYLLKLKEYFEGKVNQSFLDKPSQKTSFYEHFIHSLNSFIRKSESINNINSVKDILFMKLMYKTSPTRAIHKGISKFFETLSRNTVKKSYKKAQKQFGKLFEKFDKLDEYIIKNFGDEEVIIGEKTFTKKQLVEDARNHRWYVQQVVDVTMRESTQQARYEYMKKATSELYTKFWDESFKDFWTKNNKFKRKEMWQTFIAAEQIKANKTKLAENIAVARDMLSYTDKEMKAYILTYIENISSMISAKDNIGLDIVEKLKWYVKDKSPLSFNMEHFTNEIKRLSAHNQEVLAKKEPEQVVKDIAANIKLINNVIKEDKPADLQKMIEIYKKIAPFELAKSGTMDCMKKAVKLFDKSVRLECGDLFDKMRDLEIGSAPTDMLTLVISSSAISYALVKAKDSTEKKSIMLTSGIPIAGGILTSLISATKLISGTKSIALGVISGVILNRIGKFTNNLEKSRSKSKVISA